MKKVILILIVTLGLTFGSFAQKGKWSNPVFMEGSSFGNLFQSLYKRGDFSTMLKFTSSECIKKNGGHKKVQEVFGSIRFAYEIKLVNSEKNSDGTTTLHYKKKNIAVETDILRIVVKVENDTVKFVSSNAFLK